MEILMKKELFKNIITPSILPVKFWRYYLVSVVAHIIFLSVFLSIPLTPPKITWKQDKQNTGGKSNEHSLKKIHRDSGDLVDLTNNRLTQENSQQQRIQAGNASTEEPTEYILKSGAHSANSSPASSLNNFITPSHYDIPGLPEDPGMQQLLQLYNKPFIPTKETPASNFPFVTQGRSTSSFAKIKQYIQERKELPPVEMVKIEELINYFKYDYPQPEDDHPFSVVAELAPCQWAKSHLLLHIGLQGKVDPLGIPDNKSIIAKELKTIVQFDSSRIKVYRLIGFGTRKSKFVQAGSGWSSDNNLYMGQSVTTLYELIPEIKKADAFEKPNENKPTKKREIARIDIGYREIEKGKLRYVGLKVMDIEPGSASDNFKLASAAAQFGILLLNPQFKNYRAISNMILQVEESIKDDKTGKGVELLKLLETYKELIRNKSSRR